MDGTQNATVSFVSGGKNKSNNNKKLLSILIIGIVAAIIVGVAIFLIIKFTGNNESETPKPDGTSSFDMGEELTEDAKETTKKVLDDYIDVEIVGYERIEDETGQHGSITAKVKNTSNETTSVAVDVVAKDNDGNILDKSSLYAEGIGPSQVYTFNLFVYSTLTEDQLKSANFEVYKAYTYEAPSEANNTAGTNEETTDNTQTEDPSN